MNEFTNGHKLFSPLCPAVLVPVTMAQWTASIKHTAFQIPKADESPVLCSYLCYLSIDGVAKQTIISMNRVCVADGRLWSMGHEPRLGQLQGGCIRKEPKVALRKSVGSGVLALMRQPR